LQFVSVPGGGGNVREKVSKGFQGWEARGSFVNLPSMYISGDWSWPPSLGTLIFVVPGILLFPHDIYIDAVVAEPRK
jgi:hypothetical protein